MENMGDDGEEGKTMENMGDDGEVDVSYLATMLAVCIKQYGKGNKLVLSMDVYTALPKNMNLSRSETEDKITLQLIEN